MHNEWTGSPRLVSHRRVASLTPNNHWRWCVPTQQFKAVFETGSICSWCPKQPASWSLRASLTLLRTTLVSIHVMQFFVVLSSRQKRSLISQLYLSNAPSWASVLSFRDRLSWLWDVYHDFGTAAGLLGFLSWFWDIPKNGRIVFSCKTEGSLVTDSFPWNSTTLFLVASSRKFQTSPWQHCRCVSSFRRASPRKPPMMGTSAV